MKAALLAGALAAGGPSPAPTPCLSGTEAEAAALVALPEIIRETGAVCAERLPRTALVRQTGGAFLTQYQAEADRAWPTVRAAIVRLTDPAAALLAQSDYARPVLVSLLVPQLVGRINPADCGMLERLMTLLAPLPPRNVAGVVVTALGWLKREKAKGKPMEVPDLPLCPGAGK